MAVNFSESKTKENLMRAFAGESQARNRYTFSAETADKDGMFSIAGIFRYTAEQERAHAERFYSLLRQFSDETVPADGSWPVDLQSTLTGLLRAAQHNENGEYTEVYPKFGDIAREEGFLEAASAFYQTAEIEHTHEQRFQALADMLEQNLFFQSSENSKWICTNCGYIHEGRRAPDICPVCRHERGYFLPYSLACYRP